MDTKILIGQLAEDDPDSVEGGGREEATGDVHGGSLHHTWPSHRQGRVCSDCSLHLYALLRRLVYAALACYLFSHDEAKVRKAYFRMAQKYHPDKNPEGREMFEKSNKAYEFLCSRNASKDGPDPNNIVLVLRAQSILFTRYGDGNSLSLVPLHSFMIVRYIS